MKKIILYLVLIVMMISNIILIINNTINKSKTYIILDNKNIWALENNKINKVSKNNIKILNYAKSKLYNKETIDGYFSYDKGFKFYNLNYEEQRINNSLIVIGNIEINNYTYLLNTDINDNDIKIINKYFQNNNRKFDKSKVLSNNKIIYSIQSLSAEETGENGYSVIALSNGNNITPIYEKYSITSRASSLNKVIDINNDGKEDLILLSDVKNTSGKECYSLYLYDIKTDSYVPTINCEVD